MTVATVHLYNIVIFDLPVAAPKVEYEKKLSSPQQVKAGSMFILPVNITGEPRPTVTWTCNGKPLPTSPDIAIDKTQDSSTLTVKHSKGINSGTYQITAENDVGSDSAEFVVSVTGERNIFESFDVIITVIDMYYRYVPFRIWAFQNQGPGRFKSGNAKFGNNEYPIKVH